MKKLVILVVFVLFCVAGWAGATYFVSAKVEGQYHSFIEKYAHLGPLTISSQDYQRGFFSSTAETLLEMSFPVPATEEGVEPEIETVQLVFEHTIYNGPILIGSAKGGLALALIDTRLDIPADVEGEFETLLQEIPELDASFAHIVVGFDGNAATRIEIPPFEKQKDDGTVVWGGFVMTADYAPGPGTLVGRLDLEDVDIRFDNGSMRWHGVHGEFDLVEVLPMLFVGKNQSVFGGMDMQFDTKAGTEGKLMEVKEFKVVADSNYDGRLVHVAETIVFEGVIVDGETYGPMELDVELKNLDAQALSDFQGRMLNAYGQFNQLDPQEMVGALIPLYSELAAELMAESPEFNINKFYINTPMGEARANLQVKYDNPDPETAIDLSMLPQYIPFFDAVADLNVDQGLVKAFLSNNVKKQVKMAASANGNQSEMNELQIEALVNQQIESQIEMFAAQGFIVREGEKIKSHLTFSGGELQVNDKLIPFGQ